MLASSCQPSEYPQPSGSLQTTSITFMKEDVSVSVEVRSKIDWVWWVWRMMYPFGLDCDQDLKSEESKVDGTT